MTQQGRRGKHRRSEGKKMTRAGFKDEEEEAQECGERARRQREGGAHHVEHNRRFWVAQQLLKPRQHA
jgi:hypothetical protein